ncbi:MAG: dihydrofolate reductase family protein [Kofleriaceae bacterium]
MTESIPRRPRPADRAQVRARPDSPAQTRERPRSHVGGPRLAAAMIATNLVDEFHAFVHPFIVGGGAPLLPQHVRVPRELVRVQRLGRILICTITEAEPRRRALASRKTGLGPERRRNAKMPPHDQEVCLGSCLP